MANSLSIVAVICMFAVVAALPIELGVPQMFAAEVVPPVSSPCTDYMDGATCSADTCCNWCSVAFNASVGFCMPLIPTGPSPSMICEKMPSNCKTVVAQIDCAFTDECQWVPFGPPGTAAGMCVYDWNRCKTPAPPAVEEQKRIVHEIASAKEQVEKGVKSTGVAVIPGPTSNCTDYIDGAACSADTCCNWCSIAFNATVGFCMPLIPIGPSPSMVCEKMPSACKTIKTQIDCAFTDECSWVPFGPPGTAAGMCVYDWDRCKVLPTPPAMGEGEKMLKMNFIAAKEQQVAQQEAVEVVPSTNCTDYIDGAACSADDCCNWCSISFNSSIGFCMPLIPTKPTPSLVCEKMPSACKTVKTEVECAFSSECSWVPFGPPGTLAGMCVFDWDRCDAPLPPAVQAKDEQALELAQAKKEFVSIPFPTPPAPAPSPAPPAPKLTCNMTTSAECDAAQCCQWCGVVFNATSGFCMPVMDFPIPALTCSKDIPGCVNAVNAADCTDIGLCKWTPAVYPPNSGTCSYDWDVCKV